MPDISTSPDGRRLIIRHRGPAGPGVPDGGTVGQMLVKSSDDNQDAEWVNPPDGTDAVSGPASATSDAIALFDGASGKLVKDSGTLLSTLATVSALAAKQDAEVGKGLSEENFTTTLKAKLDGLLAEYYVGSFATKTLLEASVASPAAGNYGTVDAAGDTQIVAFYDDVNSVWNYVEQQYMTGQEIADAFLEATEASSYVQSDAAFFTSALKTQIEQHEQALNAALDGTASNISAYKERSSNYTLQDSDRTLNCTANTFTVTLPDSLLFANRIFAIKNTGAGVVTVDTSDVAQLIDGSATESLSTGDAITVQSTSSGWIVISRA